MGQYDDLSHAIAKEMLNDDWEKAITLFLTSPTHVRRSLYGAVSRILFFRKRELEYWGQVAQPFTDVEQLVLSKGDKRVYQPADIIREIRTFVAYVKSLSTKVEVCYVR